MTVSAETIRVRAVGNDATTVWPFSFSSTDDGDVAVYAKIGTGAEFLVDPADYTLVRGDTSGTVEYPLVGSPLTTADVISIVRETPYTNTYDFSSQARIPTQSIEDSDDNVVRQIQQLLEALSRKLGFSVTTSAESQDVPEPEDGKFLGWNGSVIANLANPVAGSQTVISTGDAHKLVQVNATEDNIDYLPHGAKGETVVSGGSSAVHEYVGAGTAGQVMTSNGTGVNPSMQDISNGLVFLSETIISGTPSSVDITTGIDDTYDAYAFEFINVQPVTDGAFLYGRVSIDGGSTFVSATDYQIILNASVAGSGAYTASTSTAVANLFISRAVGNFAGECMNGMMMMYNPASASFYTTFQMAQHSINASKVLENAMGASMYGAITAVDAIQFFFSTGNMNAGTIRMYGISNS